VLKKAQPVILIFTPSSAISTK